MPLHFLWTHSLHCEHSMELLPTLLQQTAWGYLSDFFRSSRSTLETMNLVSFMLTQSPLLSIPAFYALRLEIHSSWVSDMSTRRSAQRHSHGTTVRNLHNSASSTSTKSSRLRTDLWCTPTPHQTPHCIDHWPTHNSKHCGTCPGWNAQPIRPHPGSSRPTTGPFLAHGRRLSQVQRRQNRVVS